MYDYIWAELGDEIIPILNKKDLSKIIFSLAKKKGKNMVYVHIDKKCQECLKVDEDRLQICGLCKRIVQKAKMECWPGNSECIRQFEFYF